MDDLARLNILIIDAENAGATIDAHAFFEGILAQSFAFRRASGQVVDRAGFLDALASGGDRVADGGTHHFLLGSSRALTTCVVRMTVDGASRRFDNARLFARDAEGAWKLLAWANEPLS